MPVFSDWYLGKLDMFSRVGDYISSLLGMVALQDELAGRDAETLQLIESASPSSSIYFLDKNLHLKSYRLVTQ